MLPQSHHPKFGVMSRLTHLVHNAYVWCVSIALVLTWFSTSNPPEKNAALVDYKLMALTWAISILPIFLVLLLMYTAVTFGRKARYAEVVEQLHGIHHELRDLFGEMRNFQSNHNIPDSDNVAAFIEMAKTQYKEMFLSRMQMILSRLAYSYGLTSGVNCRASIKLLGRVDKEKIKDNSESNLYAKTLVRDINSAIECKKKDSSEKNEDHLVRDNTDYRLILNNKIDYYFNSNIVADKLYENSSLPYWEKISPIRTKMAGIQWGGSFLGFLKREWTSVYPYISVIVLPIRCREQNGQPGVPIGFLSVDSKSIRCFWERYDVHLAASVADSVFHLIEEYTFFIGKLHALAKEG